MEAKVHFAVVERRPIPPGNRNVPLCKTEGDDLLLTTEYPKVTCEDCVKILGRYDPKYPGVL